MTFLDWLRHQQKSSSTAKKYAGALEGVLSEWAITAGVTDQPLAAIRDPRIFEGIAKRLYTVPVFLERNTRGHNMYRAALDWYFKYLLQADGDDSDRALENDLDELLTRTDIGATERQELVKARVGQGAFREHLLTYWKHCAVTGYDQATMLTASHIKPWRLSSDPERLDEFNGLLLVPTLDRAFDRGFVSFDEEGGILLSPVLKAPSRLGISAGARVALTRRHYPYMSFHRQFVFREA